MANSMYSPDNPYREPSNGFWRKFYWWMRRQYEEADAWEQTQCIRRDEAHRIAMDLREEFPQSDIPDYIEQTFG